MYSHRQHIWHCRKYISVVEEEMRNQNKAEIHEVVRAGIMSLATEAYFHYAQASTEY